MHSDSPHPTQPELASYAARQLPAADILRVSDHLAECAVCRQMLAPFASPWPGQPGDLLTEQEDEVPDFEELAAAAEGTLSAAQHESFAAKLAASPAAREASADLAAFRTELAALPAKSHGPEQSSGAGSVSTEASRPETGKRVLFPQRWTPGLTLAAAAVVLFFSAWWLVTGTRPAASPALWADADLSRLPVDLRRSVEGAARTGEIEAPPLPVELRPPPETLAGSSPSSTGWRQLGPVGVVVREDRPTLHWAEREGATGYVVYLADDAGRRPMLRQELPGGTTEWTPSSPLERGAIYQWQVEARSGSKVIERAPRPPTPEAHFQVLGERQNAELTGVERSFGENPLILGTAYARAGLAQAARQQMEELARRHPDSKVASRLKTATTAGTSGSQ